jgi:hypothetical protein
MGFMPSLSDTPDFPKQTEVFFPSNLFCHDDLISPEDYARRFFPFGHPDLIESAQGFAEKEMAEVELSSGGTDSRDFRRAPTLLMCFSKKYSEEYKWVARQVRYWAFMFNSSMTYLSRNIDMDALRKALDSRVQFPSAKLVLLDKPMLSFGFMPLRQVVEAALLMTITRRHDLQICKHCLKAFASASGIEEYCSDKCRDSNRYYEKIKQGSNT